MPCLVLTGHPCAGKTTLAELIRQECLKPVHEFGIFNVIIINEASACLGQTRQECYGTSEAEKATRGALKASLDRVMVEQQTSDVLVILDSLNYIKGFRYELHCLSKAAQQQHGVVWVLNSVANVKEWNAKRRFQDPQNTYSDELLDELILRYEPPDERNRWDRPLFCIQVAGDDNENDKVAGSRQALEQSVYNMHDLSAVLRSTEGKNAASTQQTQLQPTQHKQNQAAASEPQLQNHPKVKFKKRVKKAPTSSAQQDITGEPPSEAKTKAAAMTAPQDIQQQTFNGGGDNKTYGKFATLAATPQRKLTLEEQVRAMLIQFLKSTQPLQQGMSTQVHIAHADADLMHLLDKVTQKVCRAILVESDKQAPQLTAKTTTIDLALGDETPTTQLSVDSRLLSTGKNSNHHGKGRLFLDDQLQTWRRQYLTWCSTHPPLGSDPASLAQEFCDYLKTQLLNISGPEA